MSSPSRFGPIWRYCGHGSTSGDPVGCRGILVPGRTACLAHLGAADRARYLSGLHPGDELGLNGTPFTTNLLDELLHALTDPATGAPRLGKADFTEATFSGHAGFGNVTFENVQFHNAEFHDSASFDGALFSGTAAFGRARFRHLRFEKATFTARADFELARFGGHAWLDEAVFSGPAVFKGAEFSSGASFLRCAFADRTDFEGVVFANPANFGGDVKFTESVFATAPSLGPLACEGTVDLSGAVFEAATTLEVAARRLVCVRTRWASTATLRLRYATVDLADALVTSPTAVTAHPAPFRTTFGGTMGIGGPLDETVLRGGDPGVLIASLQGVDAGQLVLTDTDLSQCLFAGAFHLDQIRLEGRTVFASAPAGLHRRRYRRLVLPYRWSRRRTLAEEHHWRARALGQGAATPGRPPAPGQWNPGPHHPDPALTPDPEDLATTYRQLRKAFEDGKNEPGSADFYYGEMEMRRFDRADTPRSERGLLWAYWLVSGYGLRASRALGWLALAVTATVVLMMGLGLPDAAPEQQATGTVPAGGGKVTLVIAEQDPELTLPAGDRFSRGRFDKALRVVLNSVVFRSSGQNLTTWGTYTEMASRFSEPALLALAVLAVRSRIKR
ncbi:pentapeptide repeat-containing protein [Streptomyces sp.]|uniref:pentapeptide repeat-containing protein n=1 Tax=Streptomyces sp. TaxID=1931 RepID=UPI002F4093E0